MEGGGEKGSTGNPLNSPLFGELSFDSVVSLTEFHNDVDDLKEVFMQNGRAKLSSSLQVLSSLWCHSAEHELYLR